jgi:hypothetical protein
MNSVAVKASQICVGISVIFLSYFVHWYSAVKVPGPSMWDVYWTDGNGTGSSLSTSVAPQQYHCTKAPYTFTFLSLTLSNLII